MIKLSSVFFTHSLQTPNLKILLLTGLSLVIFSGCSLICKPCEQQVKVEYQKVNIPVKCTAKMPTKPKFNPADPETAKKITAYYKECELLLKKCISQKDLK